MTGGGLLVAGLAAALWPTDPCAGAGRRVEQWWPIAAPEVAPAALETAVGLLEPLVEGWREEQLATCRARVAAEDDAERDRLLQRSLCLNGLERTLRAAARVVRTSGPEDDPRRGLERLLPAELCRSPTFAAALVPAPPEAQAAAVAEARTRLAEVRALERAGRFEAALERAEVALEAARATGFPPVEVEALHAEGRLEIQRGRYRAAARTLERAYLAARSAPHDLLAAETAGTLAYHHGFNLSDTAEGRRWAELALADARRIAGSGPLEARVLLDTGTAFAFSGDIEAARAQHRRAVDLMLRHRPADHPEVGRARGRLGATLLETDEPAGRAELRAAVEILEAALGPEHPDLVRPLTKLGLSLADSERPEVGVEHLRRALAIARAAHGETHASTGLAWLNVGVALYHQGRIEGSIEPYERAVEVLGAALGAEHPDVALASTNLGLALADLGRLDEALARHQDALATFLAAFGENHRLVLAALSNIGSILERQKDWTALKANAERSLKVALAVDPEDTAYSRVQLGLAHLELGAPGAALEQLRAALKQRRKNGSAPRYLSETLFALARAFRALGRPPARVRAAAEEAMALLRPLEGELFDRQRAELQAFLAELQP
jgi:tetratricopeptide (TPR) repeat protein